MVLRNVVDSQVVTNKFMQPEQLKYQNLEYIRNLIMYDEKFPIEGLTIEYSLSDRVYSEVDQYLFHIMTQELDEEVEYEATDEIEVDIKGVNFRFKRKSDEETELENENQE